MQNWRLDAVSLLERLPIGPKRSGHWNAGALDYLHMHILNNAFRVGVDALNPPKPELAPHGVLITDPHNITNSDISVYGMPLASYK